MYSIERSEVEYEPTVPSICCAAAKIFGNSRILYQDKSAFITRVTDYRSKAAPLPGVAWCRRRWYISKLVCDGDSNKTILQTWRSWRPSPPAATAMPAHHLHAWAGRTHILGGWRLVFCVVHVCFELGKMFPRLQRDGGKVNLKVFTKRIAVNADASSELAASVRVRSQPPVQCRSKRFARLM